MGCKKLYDNLTHHFSRVITLNILLYYFRFGSSKSTHILVVAIMNCWRCLFSFCCLFICQPVKCSLRCCWFWFCCFYYSVKIDFDWECCQWSICSCLFIRCTVCKSMKLELMSQGGVYAWLYIFPKHI